MQNGQDMKLPLCNNLCLGDLAQCWSRNTALTTEREWDSLFCSHVTEHGLGMQTNVTQFLPSSMVTVTWNYIVIELRKSCFINTLVGLSYRRVTGKQGPLLQIGFRGYLMASLAFGLSEADGLLVYSKSIYLIVTRMDVRLLRALKITQDDLTCSLLALRSCGNSNQSASLVECLTHM